MKPFTIDYAGCRSIVDQALEDLHHVLSWQAPIKDFVHRNILQGLEHQEFTQALKTVHQLTGARGFMPIETYRAYYNKGRINDTDLSFVLTQDKTLEADKKIAQSQISYADIYKVALCHPLKSITGCQFSWLIEEDSVLETVQKSVGATHKVNYQQQPNSITLLWEACLTELGLNHHLLHPEEMVDLSPAILEDIMESARLDAGNVENMMINGLIRKESRKTLDQLIDRVGKDLTLRGFLKCITGHDVLEELRPNLLKILASYLDMGLAAWHDETNQKGFYASWKHNAVNDISWVFEALPDWTSHLEDLPDDPIDTIVQELKRLDVPEEKWRDYLEVLALELPGWSAMFLWHHLNPEHPDLRYKKIEMADYLAVRLILEHLFSQRLCSELWSEAASLDTLIGHFHQHPAEFIVRYAIYNEHLPEYLVSLAHRVSEHTDQEHLGTEAWWTLAHMIFTWRKNPAVIKSNGRSVLNSGWRLFQLSQHLGLNAQDIHQLGHEGIAQIFACLKRLDQQKMGFLWLQAYEHHYREILFNALIANKGKQAHRISQAKAQFIFCMDDREEGIRRHLEEIEPQIETFGAAAHYDVPHLWQGMDDIKPTKKTPIVYDPIHLICEHPIEEQSELKQQRQKSQKLRQKLNHLLHNETRHHLFSATLFTGLAAPLALTVLASKTFAPLTTGLLKQRFIQYVEPSVIGRLELNAIKSKTHPTPKDPQYGFNSEEQLKRAHSFLSNIGLIRDFSPLIIIFGHGSHSQNNPHLNAYGCGACSGKHSGENARILAAILNRPEIRQALLEQHQIEIPSQTWFIGGEHNTSDEAVRFDDLDLLPKHLTALFKEIKQYLQEAQYRHADERCRRFASAPKKRTPKQAFYHMIGRSMDFSQARPELGHTNNAAAFIGRRSMSRGVFYDRRVFLISYDPETDKTGAILTRLLLANAPVGAGISLDYYFSTVDNQRLGSGSKIAHNVVGFFAVMDGTASDLRTGLPKQMIEIHEAMRLQVVVESTVERVTEIYSQQPALQEIIGNGWLLVSVMDQNTGEIQVFDPKTGFSSWQGKQSPLPSYPSSIAFFKDQSEPLDPAFIHI